MLAIWNCQSTLPLVVRPSQQRSLGLSVGLPTTWKLEFERAIRAIHKRPECACKADNGINPIVAVKNPDHVRFCLITSNAPSGNIYTNLKSAIRRAKNNLPEKYEIYAVIVGSNDSMAIIGPQDSYSDPPVS
jgi:hypothetical protein